MKHHLFFVIIVIGSLLLGCSVLTAGAFDLFNREQSASSSIPEAYETVIRLYYDAMYADWYEELTPEKLWEMGLTPWLYYFDSTDQSNFGFSLMDVNDDGTDELIFGLNNDVYIDTIYQMYTLIDGNLSTIYTCDNDALYLKQNKTLLWEGFDSTNPDAFSILFKLDENGYVNFLDGYLLDTNAVGGPYFKASDASLDAAKAQPISDSEYDRGVIELEKDKEYLKYESVYAYYNDGAMPTMQKSSSAFDNTSSGFNTPSSENNEGMFYSHNTLYDPLTGIPTANILVPDGWSASVSVDWTFMSTTSPGVGKVTLQSPDRKARILLVSNQAYAEFYSRGMHFNGGRDEGLYITLMDYHNAEDVQALGLENEGYGSAVLINRYDVPESIRSMVQEAAQVKLQALNDGYAEMLGCEGTAADNLYQAGNSFIEYFTMVTAAETYAVASHADLDAIYWNVPFSALLIADSRESYSLYKPVFDTVIANSDFTFEFLYANIKYGSSIDDAIHRGLMQQSYEYILSDSNSWVSEAENSSGYDSSKWADQWSDVIYERNEYETTDGGTIKVDTKYDTVYQNGDSIYMGPDGLAPDGWTKLNTTY